MSSVTTEFEPVSTGENTERKVPFSAELNCQPTDNTQSDFDSEIISLLPGQGGDNQDVIEYNRLSDLYHELPSDLFVSRLLKDYGSCENKLSHVRQMLFDILREIDDFPFEQQAELKRRMATRRGDPVSVKLANDVHVIVSVLEGEEYSCLKELISTSSRARSSSQSRITSEQLTPSSKPNSCQCSLEIPLLKDTISSLQSDVLMLKQRTFACEKLRTDEMRNLSASLSSLKCDMKQHIDTALQNFQSTVKSLESVPDSNHINAKIYDLDARIKVFEDLLDGAEVMAVSLNALCRVHPPSPPDSVHEETGTPAPQRHSPENYQNNSCPNRNDSTMQTPSVEVNNTTPVKISSRGCRSSPDTDALENFLHQTGSVHKGTPESIIDLTSSPNSATNAITEHVKTRKNAKVNALRRQSPTNTEWKPVTFSDIQRNIGTPSEPRKNGIPVRITDRDDKNARSYYSDIDTEFVTHIKKRAQRFFLGGFKNSVTSSIISKYITIRGFKVTMIRIFPSKRSPGDVIVRVNIEENDNLSTFTQNDFWPDGIICRPWLNRESLKQDRRPPRFQSRRRWSETSTDDTSASHARERYENTLVLDAGDRFTGTLWFNQYHGEAAETFVNMEKYDAMCLGNHEFDRGVAGLVPYLRNLTVPVIDANIDISQEARLEGLFNATLIKEVGGVKIGVIGYITTDTAFISNGGPTVKFDDEVTTVRREAEKLKSAGVEIVMGLSHAGYGIDKKVALEVDNIDVIVGGHSHTFLYSGPQPSKEEIEGPYPTIVTQPSGRKVLVVQAYAWGKYMGFLNVTFDKAFDVKSWSGQPVLLDNTITQDRETLEIINELKKPLEKMKAEIVGRSVVRLQGDPIQCRLRECNSGNLLTDSMIEYHIDKRESNDTWTLAAIALLSGGGIRASTEPGDISMGQVLAVQPFGNVIDMIQLRGLHLRQAFEHSVAKYDPHDRPGAFFQMSGAHVIYDISKPSGNRVVSLEVLCLKCTVPMYGPVDDEEIYNILMMDFTIKGGDGFTMIRDNLVRHVQMNSLDSDVFKTYLEKHNPVFADTEGRIKFINSPGVVIPTATASSPSSSASTMSTTEETSDTKCINGANNIGCPLLIGIGMPVLVLILKFTNILFCCC